MSLAEEAAQAEEAREKARAALLSLGPVAAENSQPLALRQWENIWGADEEADSSLPEKLTSEEQILAEVTAAATGSAQRRMESWSTPTIEIPAKVFGVEIQGRVEEGRRGDEVEEGNKFEVPNQEASTLGSVKRVSKVNKKFKR